MSNEVIKLSFQSGIRKMLINRPKRKNALNTAAYTKLTQVLNDDATNDQVVVSILTGAGEFYSSGTDLKDIGDSNLNVAKNFVEAIINYPKLLIAVVNGPAVGIAATTAALCDIVYASENAYFHIPFVHLGLCAEGASSYMFPRLLGRSKTSELLFLNKKLSAQEAHRLGLVAEVIPHERLSNFIESLTPLGSLSVEAVKLNKKLIMHNLKDILLDANKREFDTLDSCVNSEQFTQAIMAFMQRKSKL